MDITSPRSAADTDAVPGWLDELMAAPDEQPVVSLWLARRLQDAGLVWTPSPGDRFMIPDRDMDDRVFLIAPMVVEVRTVLGTQMIHFNGTTEWALDSVVTHETLWLPGETDLRRALGDRFVALRRDAERWVVEITGQRGVVPFEHPDAVGALALALLEVLRTG